MLGQLNKVTLQFFFAFTLSVAWLHAAHAAERLSAQLDRSTVAENETFSLIVKYENGDSNDKPDFSVLETNFDVLSNSQTSQYRNNNGRISNVIQWVLILAPKQAGKALIPPLQLGGAQSAPITITVTKAKALAKGAKAVFLETHVTAKEVYVQEEFTVSLKLFFKENIIDFDAEEFVIKGATFKELPRGQYRTKIGHSTYEVLELSFAITPDASGTLEAPSFLWSLRSSNAPANRFNRGSGRSTLHRLRTDPFTVKVKPRPASYPSTEPWLPAKALTLSELWSQNPPRFVVGEPITRTITLTARGLTGEQLPPIASRITSDDFKFYPDQPKITSDTDDQGKRGSRSESMAVIPTRAGALTLPAVEVTWWDTQSDSLQSAVLPAKQITVQAAAAKPEQSLSAVLPSTKLAPQTSSSPVEPKIIYKTQHGYWPWLCAALVLLNLVQGFVFMALLKKRQAQTKAPQVVKPTAAAGLKTAIAAANSNQAAACHRALNQWLHQQKTSNGQTLQHYFTQTGASDALLQALNGLDAALFQSAQNTWVGKPLAEALGDYSQRSKNTSSGGELATLYPTALEANNP